MSNLKFYIYGVPDGFNMLSGTHDEILYYQLFYDTNKKGTEMRINRKANGETIYSYLKYNLVSCKGREGAFLGMSIAFHDFEYCDNPEKLKELFEAVYNDVILKADDNDRIVVKIDGGNAVGRFCISKFSERQIMCDKIGRIVINNVVGELKKHIVKGTGNLDNIKEGRILTLPWNSNSSSINRALNSYSWISLSTEGSLTPIIKGSVTGGDDTLSPHYIKELSAKVTAYKDFIIRGLKGLVSSAEISTKRVEINRYLDTIEKYVGKQPVLLPLKEQYMAIYKEIISLTPQDTESSGQSGTTAKLPTREGKKNERHLPLIQIAMGICAVVVIACFVLSWPNDETSATDVVANGSTDALNAPHKFDMMEFNSLLNKAEYNTAWSMIQEDVSTEKTQYIRMLHTSYEAWFEEKFKESKNSKDALNKLQEKINSYSDFGQNKNEHKQRLKNEIEKLSQPPSTTESTQSAHQQQSNPIIKIFETKSDYNCEGIQPMEVKNNIITCKFHSYYVVTGAHTRESSDSILEICKQANGAIRIRVKGKAGRSRKVKLNQIEYDFFIKR